jgi:hypothetical protein
MRQRIVATVLFGLTATAQASVVEYTFTGAVTSAGGIYAGAPVGAVVVGTYSFDLDAAIPAQGFGVAGSYTSSWRVASLGGSWYESFPNPPSALVYSTTAQVLGTTLTYETGSIANFQNFANLDGYGYSGSETGSYFIASEGTATNAGESRGSGLSLGDTMIKTYGPDGLPYPVGSTPRPTVRYGYFQTTINNGQSALYFDILTLVPVPLPAAVWLFCSALCAMGVMRRKAIA